jgi:hypothetical protein
MKTAILVILVLSAAGHLYRMYAAIVEGIQQAKGK